MSPRMLTLVAVGTACIAGGAGWWWIAGREPEISHEEAMAAWTDLVANKFQGDRKRVGMTFIKCFRVGDPLSKYTEQLKTANVYKSRDSNLWTYDWYWDLGFGGEGDAVFKLHAEGDPPIIFQTYITAICR